MAAEETLESSAAALEAEAATTTAGTKGAWGAPAATIGAQLVEPVAYMIPLQYERHLKKQVAGDAKALRQAGKLTADQRAAAAAIKGRYEQQARDVMARGSAAGGMRGTYRESARALRQEGRTEAAEYLSSARKENLGRMNLLAKQVRAGSARLGQIAMKRREGVAKGIGKAATSAATSRAMKQWGALGREGAGEMREAGLSTAQKEITSARLAEKARLKAPRLSSKTTPEPGSAKEIELGSALARGKNPFGQGITVEPYRTA